MTRCRRIVLDKLIGAVLCAVPRLATIGPASLASFLVLAVAQPLAHAGHDDEYIDLVPAERIKNLLDGGEKIVFVDLRPAVDFKKAHLPGAVSIPMPELPKRYGEIPKAGRVILYCACPPGGLDESYSYLMLRSKGYRNVSVLENGFTAWAQRRFPTEGK